MEVAGANSIKGDLYDDIAGIWMEIVLVLIILKFLSS